VIGSIALKNMLHEPARFCVTVAGIGLSLVLLTVQLGLLSGFDRTISALLDHAKADLWIVPTGTAAFDDPALLENSQRYTALATKGVERVDPLIVGFAEWRRPRGGSTSVIVVGSDPRLATLAPWDIVSGKAEDLMAPDTVAVDQTYAEQLGVARNGDLARIEGLLARVSVITNGIRSFTTSPYIFSSLSQARAYLNTDQSRTSFLAVTLNPAADARAVQEKLSSKLRNVEVLTRAEFRRRNVEHWLLHTGAGIALLGGAALAALVGSVIMTQTLYASINDHRKEFATLRAMGCSKGFLRAVVLCQAAITAAAGCVLAAVVDAAVVSATADTSMPLNITLALSVVLLALALIMSAISALVATSKIASVDPASVFAQ
jgi:putative ABC transport system permease protein